MLLSLPQLSATVNLTVLLPILKLFFCSSKKFFSSVLFELSLSFETSFLPLPWPESPLPLEASSFIRASSSSFVVCSWFSVFSELEESSLPESGLPSVSVPAPGFSPVPSEAPFPSVLEPPLLASFGTIVTFIFELSITWLPVGLSLSSTTCIFWV